MSGALDGIVVADFSRVLAGPYATMLLGDLGAEVVKVERPGAGDDTRHWGPPYAADGTATYFAGVNRNKRSSWLDLSSPEGRAEARTLALRADVMVENFKPGGLARMGLGYDELAAENPRLILCSISGFGSGAGAELPGYDLLVQAMGGLMSVTGPGAGEPTKVGVALVDVITGLHAVYGILAALRHRDVTGEGQHVEVNLLSSLLSAMVNQSSAYVAGGVVPGILGNDHPSIVPYAVYATADKPLVLAVGNDRQFRSLCVVLGIADEADDERFATNPARVAHRAEVRALLETALASDGADRWADRLTAAGVPCGPINGLDDAFALATSLELAPVVHVPGSPVPQVANPLQMSVTPPTYRVGPPPLEG
ncbi:MAG TPA: CoA transferase [Candidatus Nanopelagicales bacterium]|nr:CoA transferase [Candidatus Nanopelagicales bacterium]